MEVSEENANLILKYYLKNHLHLNDVKHKELPIENKEFQAV